MRIGLIEGDGIGPEVVSAARRVVDTALATHNLTVDWVPLLLGHAAIDALGSPMPDETINGLDELDAWILGPHDNVSYPVEHRVGPPPGGFIRKRYGLFANIRPARTFAGVPSIGRSMDLVIVRENTEGFYSDRNMFVGSGEFMPTADVAMQVGVVTRAACERIAQIAFELAQSRRRQVTVVHKANVLPLTTGLFRDVCREVGEAFPDVELVDEHVDAMAALLVRRPDDFDVIVTENLFGDILSDLAGELAGSIGLSASLNCSTTKAMAQAVHGAAPTIAGQNVANPAATILSSAMLLRWLSTRFDDAVLSKCADTIEEATAATLESGVRTRDLGGAASTSEFTDRVCAAISRT
ncbi:MAG: isocitrate/isopropylmalate dehydrogenase family protein [Nocardiaceae bacterium]|nr:isocitrate/isopropylmalate dehydrogenase family protein [Nocardiaceae bacterium]